MSGCLQLPYLNTCLSSLSTAILIVQCWPLMTFMDPSSLDDFGQYVYLLITTIGDHCLSLLPSPKKKQNILLSLQTCPNHGSGDSAVISPVKCRWHQNFLEERKLY